jgi:sugar/nucleoside kinase (ribokinase family)
VSVHNNPKPRFTLYTYGDILVELSTYVETVPMAGQDTTIEGFRMLPGGSAANCAVSAAHLGAKVNQIGVVGQDPFSKILLDDLSLSEVSTEFITCVPGTSAFAVIVVDSTGERTMLSYRDISTTKLTKEITKVCFSSCDYLHVSGYAFQTEHTGQIANNLLIKARAAGTTTSIDPSFQFASDNHKSFKSLLEGLDYIFPNQDEAYQMTGESDPAQAALKILDYGVKCVVVTCGSSDCIIVGETVEGVNRVPSYEVSDPVDSTGAGDGFIGGFLAARMRGFDVQQSARIGHAVAANVVMEFGGHSGSPNTVQLQQFAGDCEDTDLLQLIEDM